MILKKLRIRFIIMNMCFVSIVLIGIFLANTISTAQRIASNSYLNLIENRRSLDATLRGESPPKKAPKAFPQDIIWVGIDQDEKLIINEQTAPEYSDEKINEIVTLALSSKSNRGILRSYDLRYEFFNTPNGEILIGFIDVSYEQAFIYEQVTSYLLIGLVSLLVFFIISFFLSKIVIKPVDKAFKQQQQFISDASHEL